LRRTRQRRERHDRARVQLTLVRLLGHPAARIRLVAAKSLAPYARQIRVEKRLMAAFGTEQNASVRAWIVHALRGESASARALVLRALRRDPAPKVRVKAAERLEASPFGEDPATARALRRALQKDDALAVRQRAAQALGSVRGDPAVDAALLRCLGDAQLGPYCALGLGRRGAKGGYQAVTRRVRAALTEGPLHPLYVWALVEFVGAPFFDASAQRGLLQQLARSRRQPDPVRQYAVKALGRLGRRIPAQRPAVKRALQRLGTDSALAVSVKLALAALATRSRDRRRRPRTGVPAGRVPPNPARRPAARPGNPAPR
jgi:hypothetical protein